MNFEGANEVFFSIKKLEIMVLKIKRKKMGRASGPRIYFEKKPILFFVYLFLACAEIKIKNRRWSSTK